MTLLTRSLASWAPLLGVTNTGTRATKAVGIAASDFYKHQRPVTVTHDQIDFTAASARRPIIAINELQALRLQIGQRRIFGQLATRGGVIHRFDGRPLRPLSKEIH